MNRTTRRPLARAVPLVATAALAAVVLTGCNAGSGTSASAATKPAATGSAAAGSGGAPARARFAGGGPSGPVASVSGDSFTLTSASGATDTIDWTSSTTFERTASGSLADVAAGACVLVTEAPGSDASTGSVDAAAVRISRPANGSCSPGAGRPSGAPGGGFGGAARPSGGQGRAFAGVLAGTVSSVSGTGFVVDVVTRGSDGGSGSTTTTAVAVSGSTTYSVTTAATAGALAVGECARVFSRARSAAGTPTATPRGPVTAVSVSLSDPVNGRCATAGPGMRAGRSASGSTGGNA